MSWWMILIAVLVGIPLLPVILGIIGMAIYFIFLILLTDAGIILGLVAWLLKEVGLLKDKQFEEIFNDEN
jgi:type IV secretory pathway VirB3-like protein